MPIFFVEIFPFLRKIIKEEIEDFCCLDFYTVYIVNVAIFTLWLDLVEFLDCYLHSSCNGSLIQSAYVSYITVSILLILITAEVDWDADVLNGWSIHGEVESN